MKTNWPELIEQNKLDLTEIAKTNSAIRDMLDCFPSDEALVITNPVLDKSSLKNITIIKGNLRYLDLTPNVKLTIDRTTNTYSLETRLLPILSLPAFEQFSLNNVDLALLANGHGPVRGKLSCLVELGNFDLPLSVELPNKGLSWEFFGDFKPIKVPEISQLAAALGVGQIIDFIPEDFLKFDDLKITRFSISVQPLSASISYLSFGLSLKKWEPVKNKFALKDIDLWFSVTNPASKQVAFSGDLSGKLLVAGKQLPVNGNILGELELRAYAEKLQLDALIKQHLPQAPKNLPQVLLQDASIVLKKGAVLSLSAKITTEIGSLVKALKIPLPETLNKIVIQRIFLDADPGKGTWRMGFEIDQSLPLFDQSSGQFTVEKIALSIERDSTKKVGIECHFKVNGLAKFEDDVTVAIDKLECKYSSRNRKWSIDSDIKADALNKSIALVANIAKENSIHVLRLTYRKALLISDFDGAGKAVTRNFSIFLKRQSTTRSKSDLTWGVDGDISLKLNGLFDTTGKLTLQKSRQGPQLLLTAEPPKLKDIEFPFEGSPRGKITLQPITLKLANSKSGGASFEVGAQLKFSKIPKVLKSVLSPAPLDGKLVVNKSGAQLQLETPKGLQPTFPELSLKFSKGKALKLGQPEIKIKSLVLLLEKQPRFQQNMQIGIPKQLNYLFGKNNKGKPNVDLFNARFDLALELGQSLSLKPITSPFKGLKYYEKYQSQWTNWNFSKTGKFSFQIPEFSFHGGRWQAKAGFERLSDIQIPLSPIKFLLKKIGVSKLLQNAIPDGLPIHDLDLTDQNFSRQMRKLLGKDVLNNIAKPLVDTLDEFLKLMASGIDRMPTHMKGYLSFKVPKSGLIDFEVDPSGGTQIGFSTTKGEALKFLMPMMTPPVPSLVGITVRSFSFGQRAGGTLAVIGFDGHIDKLNLVSLIAAITTNKGKALTHRFHLQNVKGVMPTGLPVFIPLFFDRVALEHRDILGFKIDSEVRFPDPELSPFDAVRLFVALFKFFSDEKYLLHQKGLPEKFKLDLTIGTNQLKLPKYLGGKEMGIAKALPSADVDQGIALLFDGLKTGRIGYLTRAIPLYKDTGAGRRWNRLGSIDIKFAGMDIARGMWCATTPKEFTTVLAPQAIKKKKLKREQTKNALLALPGKIDATDDQTLAILLMGIVQLGPVASLQAQFGMLAGPDGLRTAMRWTGTVAKSLSLTVVGEISTEDGYKVNGLTELKLRSHTLISNSNTVHFSNKGLKVDSVMRLTPWFQIDGTLVIGMGQFIAMRGQVSWKNKKGKAIVQVQTAVAFGKDGLSFSFGGKLLGLQSTTTISLPGGPRSLFSANVSLQPPNTMHKAFQSQVSKLANDIAESSVDFVYNQLQDALDDVGDMELSIKGVKKWGPQMADETIDTINKTIIRETKKWYRLPMRRTAFREAKPYINRVKALGNACKKGNRKKIKAAIQDIIDHNTISVEIFEYRWKFIQYKGFTVYKDSDLLGAGNITKLKQAKEAIDRLPDSKGKVIDATRLYDALPPRKKIMGEINRDLKKGISGSLPKIESLNFKSSLGALDATGITLNAVVLHHDKRKTYKIKADFNNPAKMAKQLAKSFAKA